MKFFNFCKKLIQKEAQESSKRFIALMILILIFYAVLRFTNYENIEFVLGELISFILVLTGQAVWEKTRKNEKNDDQI
jgi:hypothetical protein